jgi:type IV secretion system protein VirD4
MNKTTETLLNKSTLMLVLAGAFLVPMAIAIFVSFVLSNQYFQQLSGKRSTPASMYLAKVREPITVVKAVLSVHEASVQAHVWLAQIEPHYQAGKLSGQYLRYYNHYRTTYASMPFYTRFYLPPLMSLLLSIIGLFMMRAPLMDFRPFKEKESVHGDAKWADEMEIRRAKLRAKKGLLLGRTGAKNYLIADDFQHVLLFAPTGSGKGVGFVIPNLLFWEESAVVHDIKMENYELTSGYRKTKMKQDIFLWNPADPNGVSHCYNPLDWLSDKPGQLVDDAQKICNLVLPEQEFWQNEARSLLLGIILYLVAVPEKMTSFGEVVRTMRSDDVVYNLAVVLDTIGGKIHPVAYMNIAAFLQKADKERSGVVSTMNSGLELWANPLIDTTTATSDFDLQDLKKKQMTVYCGVTPDNLQRLEPLLKVFYQQATDFMTRHMPGEDEPHGVMFMMDEFPSLGEMPQFQIGIAYFRGYRVKLFLIVQDTQQLKGIYEEAGMNSFLSNSYYRVTFSANNIETANMISQLVGNKTMEQESHNKPKFLDFNPAARTLHVSETQRALLLPQEVIQLPRDEQIILVESFAPIKCEKIFYYKDSTFTKRLLPQIPIPLQEPYDPRKKKKVETAEAPPSPEAPDAKGGSGDAAAGGAASGGGDAKPPADGGDKAGVPAAS